MNTRKAAEIAFGVLGVWLIVASTPAIAGLVISLSLPSADQSGSLRWLGFVQIGLFLLCGLGLMLLRRRLAAWLVPNVEAVLEGSTSGFQAAAYSVIGVLSFARGQRSYRSIGAGRAQQRRRRYLETIRIARGANGGRSCAVLWGAWSRHDLAIIAQHATRKGTIGAGRCLTRA